MWELGGTRVAEGGGALYQSSHVQLYRYWVFCLYFCPPVRIINTTNHHEKILFNEDENHEEEERTYQQQ